MGVRGVGQVECGRCSGEVGEEPVASDGLCEAADVVRVACGGLRVADGVWRVAFGRLHWAGGVG